MPLKTSVPGSLVSLVKQLTPPQRHERAWTPMALEALGGLDTEGCCVGTPEWSGFLCLSTCKIIQVILRAASFKNECIGRDSGIPTYTFGAWKLSTVIALWPLELLWQAVPCLWNIHLFPSWYWVYRILGTHELTNSNGYYRRRHKPPCLVKPGFVHMHLKTATSSPGDLPSKHLWGQNEGSVAG